MTQRLLGRKALITGGARGIGRGIAERFVREGADVALMDIREEALGQTVRELRETATRLGGENSPRIEAVVCDLADPGACRIREAADAGWALLGGIDILINNAGVAAREPFTDIPYERWRQVMDVNVNAMFVLSQAVGRRMIAEGRSGSIVNMASKNGLAGSPMLAHYNASKGAVVLLTQSMAVELAPFGIRVNAVAPGFIDTPLDRELKAKGGERLELTKRTPMGRLGTVEEAASAFLFLASEEASYITGATLVVDGGHLAGASDF